MIKFEFTGLNVMVNRINRSMNKLQNELESNIIKEADFIEQTSHRDAPIDTRWLVGSQYRKQQTFTNFYSEQIGFTAKYAPYQEFGTGNKVNLNGEYSEFQDFAYKFKTHGLKKGGNRPKKYFLHNYIIARKRLARKTSTMLKNIMK